MKKIALLIAMLASTGRAAACDLCGCYTPQLESLPPAESAAGRSWLTGIYGAIAEQFTHFDTVQVDGNEVSNPTGQHLDSFITQLVGGYSFNKYFSLQVNMPLIYRSFSRPEGFAIDRGTESGLAIYRCSASWSF